MEEPNTNEPQKKSNKKMWIIIVVVIILLCCLCTALIGASGVITSSSIQDGLRNNIPTIAAPIEEITGIASPSQPETNTPSDLPTTPIGYSWQACPSMDSYFLKPNGWYFLEELQQGSNSACYISKEDINTNYVFQTGLTVFMYNKVTTEVGTSASEYAKNIIESMKNENNSSEVSIVDSGNGVIGYGVYINSDFDGTKVSQYTVAMANDASDRVYLITFESPTSEWTDAWSKEGGTIIDNLMLYVI